MTSLPELARRLGITNETLATAVQTVTGGVKEYMRRHILEVSGQSRVIGRKPDGKGIETIGDAFERITGEKVEQRGKRAKVG